MKLTKVKEYVENTALVWIRLWYILLIYTDECRPKLLGFEEQKILFCIFKNL